MVVAWLLVVVLLSLGVRGGVGGWCFLLGGGFGLVVVIFLGGVRGGGVVVGFGCGR